MPLDDFVNTLTAVFEAKADPKIASQQSAYLRDQFLFYGLKTPVRREIQKPFLVKEILPPKKELERLVRRLWNSPQREYHYFAQELIQKYTKHFEENDIFLFEFMITNNSWWDTVDFILPQNSSKDTLRNFPTKGMCTLKNGLPPTMFGCSAHAYSSN